MRIHALSLYSLWWPVFVLVYYSDAASLRRHISASTTAFPKPNSYSSIHVRAIKTSASAYHLHRRDQSFCWAVEDSSKDPPIFCSCSNSQTYQVVTQAPTLDTAFGLCPYTTYPSAASTDLGGEPSVLPIINPLPNSSPTSSVVSSSASSPPSTSISSFPSASTSPGIPLWGQCGLTYGEVCAGEALCICKDQWWSQCREPIAGSWVPLNESWQCSGPNISTSVTSSSTTPLDDSAIRSTSVNALKLSLTTPGSFETPSSASIVDPPLPSHSANANNTAPFLVVAGPFEASSNGFSSTSTVPPSSSSLAPSADAAFKSSSITAAPPSRNILSLHLLPVLSGISVTAPVNFYGSSETAIPSSISVSNGSQATYSLFESLLTSSTNASAATSTKFSLTSTAPVGGSSLSTSHSSSMSLATPISSTGVTYGKFTITISVQASVSSLPALTTPVPSSLSQSLTAVAIGFPVSSSVTLLPNLACPTSSSSTEAEQSPQSSNSASSQACNPNMAGNPGNLSSTTNSSATPEVPLTTDINPDKQGVYSESNSTVDQQAACQNFAAHQYQACWEVLNITGYIMDWVSFNQKECDDESMGFADCFTYIEVQGGDNCTAFTGRSQCNSPNSQDFMGRTNGAQAFYVAFNIWNIQNWFWTFYLAVQGANGLASDNVENIAKTLNVSLPKSFPVLDLLAALAWAFGLLSPSGYAAALPKLGEKIEGLGAQAPGEYLLRAVQNSPTFSRNLIAVGDLSQTDVQVAQLGSDLARITSQLETNIQNSVVVVLSNFSLFFDFVQDGYFSSQIEDLNTVATNVTLSLNTYVVSQALQDDKVIITRALDTDVNELQLNGSAVNYNTGCGYGYDEWGMCGSWWYDSTNDISYGLESQKDMMINYTDVLESLFNQGITTPELLFINSQVCADAAGSTQGSAPGTSLSTSIGVWDTECISNLKICSWDLVNLGVTDEFTDCNHESAFAAAGCGDGEDTLQVDVPTTYIGPYLTSDLFQGQVCDSWSKGMGNPDG